jgi:hypothetical protein
MVRGNTNVSHQDNTSLEQTPAEKKCPDCFQGQDKTSIPRRVN